MSTLQVTWTELVSSRERRTGEIDTARWEEVIGRPFDPADIGNDDFDRYFTETEPSSIWFEDDREYVDCETSVSVYSTIDEVPETVSVSGDGHPRVDVTGNDAVSCAVCGIDNSTERLPVGRYDVSFDDASDITDLLVTIPGGAKVMVTVFATEDGTPQVIVNGSDGDAADQPVTVWVGNPLVGGEVYDDTKEVGV